MTAGKLYLVPTRLDEEAPVLAALPAAVIERIHGLRDFVVEDAKSARRFLAACRHPVPLREISMTILDEHTAPREIATLLGPVREGRDLGLMSEAGLPAVADPGAALVAAAHAEGVSVVPLPGPSSILLALAASGLEGQRFRFVGYLPVRPAERRDRLRELEERSARDRETQIFIETPYRNEALLDDVLTTCRPTTRFAVASGLTGTNEHIRTATVSEWARRRAPLGKSPAVFLLLA